MKSKKLTGLIRLKKMDLLLKWHWHFIKKHRIALVGCRHKSGKYWCEYDKLRHHTRRASVLQTAANIIAEERYGYRP